MNDILNGTAKLMTENNDLKLSPIEQLYEGCKNNEDIEKLEEIVKNVLNVNEVAKNGDTCLCIACNKGNENVVQFLIKHKADVNKPRSPTSALSSSITSGITARRQSRLVANQQPAKGDAPLNIALKYGYEGICSLLIDNGADVTGMISNQNPEFEKSPLQEAIRINRLKTLDRMLKTIFERNNGAEIDWLFSKRYDLLRQVFIGENIEAIRTVLPYIIEKSRIDGEILVHILNHLLMKSKIQEKKEKAYEILETAMEIGTYDDEEEESIGKFEIYDLDILVKGFLATLRALFNTVSSDDNRTSLLHFRSSLFFFIIKYQKALRNFDEFYNDIDFTFSNFYNKMTETGENVLKLIEFFITFYDTLITMDHLHLTASNVQHLLRLEHVKQIDILGEFLIQRSLTPLDLKELCRIRIKEQMKSYNYYSIKKLPVLDDKCKEFLFFN